VSDSVERPKHYTSHPTGIECIEIVEHLSFNIGNAMKYLWRAGLKGDVLEDLRKAKWYVEREIARVKGWQGPATGIAPDGRIKPRADKSW